jgi:hypothetical protein
MYNCQIEIGAKLFVSGPLQTALRAGALVRSRAQGMSIFLCGSENKQRLFPYTALTDWFL